MKRIVTLMLAAGLILGATAPKAEAVELKVWGGMTVIGEYYDNMRYQKGQDTGFTVAQRLDAHFQFVASENVSATLRLRSETKNWGDPKTGYAIASSGWGGNIGAHWAYMDFMIPNTSAKVRMGLMPDNLLSYTSMVMPIGASALTGIKVDVPLNDNVGLYFAWHRPLWTPSGAQLGTSTTNHTGAMDVFSFNVPMKFDAFRITPWAKFGLLNENVNYGYVPGQIIDPGINGSMAKYLFPLANSIFPATKLQKNATAYWLGFTSQLIQFKPFTLSLDAIYGSVDTTVSGEVNYKGEVRDLRNVADRAGWYVASKAAYDFDFGSLALMGWYASGDDSDPLNGSERLPAYGADYNPASSVAFGAQDLLFAGNRSANSANVYGSPAGTWGLALGLSRLSFIENLNHSLWVIYTQGTNSASLIQDNVGYATSPAQYLTNKDSVTQFGFTTNYNMYKELLMRFQIAYAVQDFSETVWGDNKKFGNAFNAELSFNYIF